MTNWQVYVASCLLAYFLMQMSLVVFQQFLTEAGETKLTSRRMLALSCGYFVAYAVVWPLALGFMFAWALGGFLGSLKWNIREWLDDRRQK